MEKSAGNTILYGIGIKTEKPIWIIAGLV